MRLLLFLAIVAFEACLGGKNEGSVDVIEGSLRGVAGKQISSTEATVARPVLLQSSEPGGLEIYSRDDTQPTRRSMRASSVDSTDSSTSKVPATYTPGSASPPCTMHTYFSPRPLEDVASRAGNAETLRSWRAAWEVFFRPLFILSCPIL